MDVDLATAAPVEVYRAIIDLDDEEFEDLMADPECRARVLDAIVGHMAGGFRPDRAGDLEKILHVKLWDRPGGGYDHFELVIAGGDCRVSDAPAHEPDLTLKIRPVDLRALVAGKTGPRRLALKRRLTVLGDLKFGMQLQDLFSFG